MPCSWHRAMVRMQAAFSVLVESEPRLYLLVLMHFLRREPLSTALENASARRAVTPSSSLAHVAPTSAAVTDRSIARLHV